MSQKSAKKRRGEERARKQQNAPEHGINVTEDDHGEKASDLEELLKAGDIDCYAQVCWSLANRMEGPPKVGDAVTNFGPCEEHGSHEYRFRLTLRSMMTIIQCVGMETCGEAIRLVAKKLPPEDLPCYAH